MPSKYKPTSEQLAFLAGDESCARIWHYLVRLDAAAKAMTRDELAEITLLPDREVRRAVEALAVAGFPVVPRRGGGGYYCGTVSVVGGEIKTLVRTARALLARAKGLRKAQVNLTNERLNAAAEAVNPEDIDDVEKEVDEFARP